LFFVKGANLTIASPRGLQVIDAFSKLSFSQVFGQASAGLCAAQVLSVMQIFQDYAQQQHPSVPTPAPGESGAFACRQTSFGSPMDDLKVVVPL